MQSTIINLNFSTELFCPPDPPPPRLLFFSSQKQKQKQGRCAILASRHHCRPLSTIKHIATYLQLPLSHHLHPTYSILSHYTFYSVKRSIVTSDKPSTKHINSTSTDTNTMQRFILTAVLFAGLTLSQNLTQIQDLPPCGVCAS